MGEFSPAHWLIVLFFVFGVLIGLPLFIYKHGKSVGDQEGYNRGYKEGQQAVIVSEALKQRS